MKHIMSTDSGTYVFFDTPLPFVLALRKSPPDMHVAAPAKPTSDYSNRPSALFVLKKEMETLKKSNECCSKALSGLKQEIETPKKSNGHCSKTSLQSTNETQLNMSNECCAKALSLLKQEIEIR